jgi:nucleoid DNA-binding protein
MPLYYLTERDVMTALAATGQEVKLRDFGLLSAASRALAHRRSGRRLTPTRG